MIRSCEICDQIARRKLLAKKSGSSSQFKEEVEVRRKRFEYFREHPEALREVRWPDGVRVMSKPLVAVVAVVNRQSRLDEGVCS